MLQGCQPLTGGAIVAVIQFDTDPVAPELPRGGQGRSAAAKRIQHKIARLRKSLDEWVQRLDGLLGRVKAVAGIGKIQHIGDGCSGRAGLPFASK